MQIENDMVFGNTISCVVLTKLRLKGIPERESLPGGCRTDLCPVGRSGGLGVYSVGSETSAGGF